jgi:hypothetical protein
MLIRQARDLPWGSRGAPGLRPTSVLNWFDEMVTVTPKSAEPQRGTPFGSSVSRRVKQRKRKYLIVGASLAAVSVLLIIGSMALYGWGLFSETVNAGDHPIPLVFALNLSASRDSTGVDSGLSACAAAACNFYNFTVLFAHSNLPLGDLLLQIRNPSGEVVTFHVGLVVIGPSGSLLGSSNFTGTFTGGDWAPAGAAGTSLRDTDIFVFYTAGPSPQSLTGDTLLVIGQNAYGSEISFPYI